MTTAQYFHRYYLFARPSFVEGVGRIFDFGNALTMYNYALSPTVADARAIREDWQAVGDDLSLAINALTEEFRAASVKAG